MTSFSEDGELGELLAQMQQLQASVAQAEAAANLRTVEGSAAGGAVRVRASGEFSFDSVTIDPSVVDPSDVALLEDLVLVAVRDAVTRLTAVRRAAMGAVVNDALAGMLGESAAYDLRDIGDGAGEAGEYDESEISDDRPGVGSGDSDLPGSPS